ncbi:MAG: efflux RND transporter permease subunit [bacterium]
MIKAAISNPYATLVGVIILLIFGAIAMGQIPVQLKPAIEPPEVSVQTFYFGASPIEIEDQITNKLEEQLNTINDLRRITSSSNDGYSSINLEFVENVDKNRALLDVQQAVNLVTDLPDKTQIVGPVIALVSAAQNEQIMWISLGGDASVDDKYDMVKNVIEPRLLRLQGVGSLLVAGGRERQIVVEPDLEKMTLHGIGVQELMGRIRSENRNVRGGYLDEGETQLIVRTMGKYESLDDIRNTVVRHDSRGTIRVGDICTVVDGRERQQGYVKADGNPTVAIGVSRQSGANTVSTIKGVMGVVAEYNSDFAERGIEIEIREAYSELSYIEEAIALVRNNLLFGALLAAIVLSLFLRGARPILIVIVTIPVSLITVFIILLALGRTINIISLAGLAFSVGMVVDNAIVVLENIDRHMKELGKPVLQAAYDAITEIAGAILASTLTTIAVFIPIILNTTEAGLLFKDIAIAIVSSIVISLLCAYTVVPGFSAVILRSRNWRDRIDDSNPALAKTLDLITLQWLGTAVERFYQRFLNWACAGVGKGTTPGRLILLGAVAVGWYFSTLLLPGANYLPTGTQPFIFCFTPSVVGQSNEVTSEAYTAIENFVGHDPEFSPKVKTYFSVASAPFFTGMGVRVKDEFATDRMMDQMAGKLMEVGFMQPGFQFFFASRTSIFRVPDKEFTLEITGPDLEEIRKISERVQAEIRGKVGPYLQPGPVPVRSGYSEGVPELAIHVDRYKAAQLGLNLSDVANVVETMIAGLQTSKFTDRGREYDIVVRGDREHYTTRDELQALTVLAGNGEFVRLDEVATVDDNTGPTSIRHYNRDRSIQLTVNTNPAFPTQTALDITQQEVIDPLSATLAPGYRIRFGDAADKLRNTLSSLVVQGALAIVIIYLLMVALFRSFTYPIIILVTVPLAWSGSFIAMWFAHTLSGGVVQFDVLGMLGLIILSGIVVNNAILIVHQMLNNQEEGMSPLEALKESSRTRLRPIFMSVLTSVFGMLPLAMGQGSGSELYRGLGVIVVGGMLVSTIFTLFVVPTILSLVQEVSERIQLKREHRQA